MRVEGDKSRVAPRPGLSSRRWCIGVVSSLSLALASDLCFCEHALSIFLQLSEPWHFAPPNLDFHILNSPPCFGDQKPDLVKCSRAGSFGERRPYRRLRTPRARGSLPLRTSWQAIAWLRQLEKFCDLEDYVLFYKCVCAKFFERSLKRMSPWGIRLCPGGSKSVVSNRLRIVKWSTSYTDNF